MNEAVEKIIVYEYDSSKKNNCYIPEDGWVIRNIRLSGNNCMVWLQKSDYLK